MRVVRTNAAFTLVELLVVIAIIAALIAIVAPGLTIARESGAAIKCQSNLRQWGTALILYAHNNNCCLPRRGQGIQQTSNIDRPTDWFNAIPLYMGQPSYSELARASRIPRPGTSNSIWLCPQAQDVSGPNYFSYAMNMRLSP